MSAEGSSALPSPFVADDESEAFQMAKFSAYYIWVVLHELFGHGTGKMMSEEADGSFNFDRENPPVNPLTGKPIDKWYLPGQTWTGQFEDLATTVDECRAELVGAYLMDNQELLSVFGFTDKTDVTAEELTYNTYMQLAVDGLRGLANYNTSTQTWGQAHSRAHFATLKCLLRDGDGSVGVNFDASRDALTVHVDKSRFLTDAKTALGNMLLHLHMYRCTGDAVACRTYYEDLSSVDGDYLRWREAVVAAQQPKWVFVQANTFLEDGRVTLKEYEPTPAGVIESWAERKV
jgi:dipeptidyl-peptidase III